MAELPAPDDFSRYATFNIHTTTYKTINSHAITTSVLIPRNLKCPDTGAAVIIRYHGGYFITASSLFPGFFAPFLLEYAVQHSAIIVTPNYRLLPDCRQSDILTDIEDHWQWLHSSLATYLASATNGTVKPDLTRIITTGESAGGYLSLMTGLNHPNEIRAVTASCPCTDLKSPFFTTHYHKQILTFPQLDLSALSAAHEARMAAAGTKIRSEDPTLENILLMIAHVQHGTLVNQYFDLNDPSQFPIERVERGERFTRGGVYIWQGSKDSVVPVEGTRKFVDVLRRADPKLKVRLMENEEGEHGFETEMGIAESGLGGLLAEVAEVWVA